MFMQCADEIQTEVVVQPDIDVKMEDVFNNINDIQLDSTTPLSELENCAVGADLTQHIIYRNVPTNA